LRHQRIRSEFVPNRIDLPSNERKVHRKAINSMVYPRLDRKCSSKVRRNGSEAKTAMIDIDGGRITGNHLRIKRMA